MNHKTTFLAVLIAIILVTSMIESVSAATVANKPANLRVVGVPTNSSLTLAWDVNGTENILGYNIYRASPVFGQFNTFGDYTLQLINTTNIGGATVTYRNSTLAPGEFYQWSVIAFNATGSSTNATALAGSMFNSNGTDFGTIQNFMSGQTFGANATFAINQTFTGIMTFSNFTNFANSTAFFQGQSFTGLQNFTSSSLLFGNGSSFNTAQTFGFDANFTGAQTFIGSNTFGNNSTFGEGQIFPAVQTFGSYANFTGQTTFLSAQPFSFGSIFAVPQVFPQFVNFTGAQTFTGTNAFELATEFGAGQIFPANVPQNFTRNISFGKNTNFGANQTFFPGIKFDTGTTFAANQPMPANVVLPGGLLLSAITCPDTSCTTTASQVLSPGEKLTLGTDPDPVSSAISTSDKSISIPGLGFEMTFSTVSTAGTVAVDLMNPSAVSAATAASDGSLTMTASNGNTLHSLTSIMDISVNATSGASTSGSMTVTLPYDETTLNGVSESDLKMIHYTGGAWIEENSCTIDTTNNKITCTVTSLSPFGIGSSSSSSSSSSTGGAGDSTPPSIVTTFSGTDYPVFIGDTPYTAEQLQSPVLTKTVETGSPVKIKLLLYDNGGPQNISHVEMYVNRHGTAVLNDLTETSIVWDKNKDLKIINPYGIISDGTVEQTIQANKVLFTFDVTFAKEFDTSDVLFVVWDYKRNSIKILTQDALEVIGSSTNAILDTDISKSSDATNVKSVPTDADATSMPIAAQDHMISIKKWGGYSSELITDSQILHDIGINADYVPSWVKKNIPKWVVSNKITEQDFVNAIQYLHKKGIVN